MNQEINTSFSFPEAADELMRNSAWTEQLLVHVDSIKNSRGKLRTKEIGILESKIVVKLNSRANRILIQNKVSNLFDEFKQNLSQKFPHLTNNELQLCCYLKLNFSPETIAKIKDIDITSVIMATYRIKKKMELPENIRLCNYIKSV